MKWETLQGDVHPGSISSGELAIIEAQRAIAEQLEGIRNELVVAAHELGYVSKGARMSDERHGLEQERHGSEQVKTNADTSKYGTRDEIMEKIAKIAVPVLFQVRMREGGSDVVIKPMLRSGDDKASIDDAQRQKQIRSIEPGDMILILARVYTVRNEGGYFLTDGSQKRLHTELSPAMEDSFVVGGGSELLELLATLLDAAAAPSP